MNDNKGAQDPGHSVILEWGDENIAYICLGRPDERVVTLTESRMRTLEAALSQVIDRKAKGVVFLGPNPEMFTAGADINVIRDVTDPKKGEALAKQGQNLFDTIEGLSCPTIAAISGPCVGGGCELVLACNFRLISDHKSSTIGLPETKLGILPGFGGTQRLPRLIGLPKALDIILAGKTLKPNQARSCGLVNEVLPAHKLKDRATEYILKPATRKVKKPSFVDRVLTFTGLGRGFVRRRAEETIAKQGKGFYPAPPKALDSALFGLQAGQKAGLEREAKYLGELIITPESKSLVKIFFLTESAKSIGRSARKSVEQLRTMVVGAGVMGAGIAGVLAKSECSVLLRDSDDSALKRGIGHVKRFLNSIKYLTEIERNLIINRIELDQKDSPSVGGVQLAVEAIIERIDAKKQVLSEIAKQVHAEAILATNTSSLSVTEIARGIENPERVIGMHFFNPVEKMPLIEIVRGEETNDRTVVVVAALATKLGKFPIVVKDVPGFLVNRVLAPYLNEAAYMLAEGYRIEDIDAAAVSFGMPMGPIRLLDEVGLDVAAHVSEILLQGYGERFRAPSFAAQLAALGRKGKKTGAGFYDFTSESEDRGSPHAQIRTLLKITEPEKHVSDRNELTERLLLPMINEAMRCLDEGVAGTPGPDAANQIDLGTVMGIGFPPFRGGLLHYADTLGAKHLLEALRRHEKSFGERFAPAPGIFTRSKRSKHLSERI